MSRSFRALRGKIQAWLSEGISPERLALTLALGFAIGCLPLIGIPTALCLVVAFGLRLNIPAIQAANYAAMPLQVALIFPFVRLGAWLFPFGSRGAALGSGITLHGSPARFLWASGGIAGQALGAWLLTAIPSVLLMTFCLTLVLRRVPVIAKAPAGD